MINLPNYENKIIAYKLIGEPLIAKAPTIPFNRIAFAAAHVVSDPLAERNPWNDKPAIAKPAIDWDATLAFRIALWDQGLGLAEAMDTAQRGMGVDWLTAKELINRTMKEAKLHPMKPRVACGAGTDHIALSDFRRIEDIIAAYSMQMEAIEAAGGQIIIMASKAFRAIQAKESDYIKAYGHLIKQASSPVILHWLGTMFDPALEGYWGSDDVAVASNNVLGLIREHADKIDGIKISLLNEAHEMMFRRLLPKGVKLYTGDDFNYSSLIAGDGDYYSDALLGIFAAIAPAASQALQALAVGDIQSYDRLLTPTIPLSREIFKEPTRFYKAGIAFLAWLNGYQNHFIMPAGLHASREISHYAEVFRLADQANLLLKPDLAISRMRNLLNIHGIV